jgi:hypothetical protein
MAFLNRQAYRKNFDVQSKVHKTQTLPVLEKADRPLRANPSNLSL